GQLPGVESLREAPRERDGDGFLHLVTRHHVGSNFAPPPHVRGHARFHSTRMVLIRAISRRMRRSSSGFDNASVAPRNLSRNRSTVRMASCCSSSSPFISPRPSGFFAFLAMLPFLPPHELRRALHLARRIRQ